MYVNAAHFHSRRQTQENNTIKKKNENEKWNFYSERGQLIIHTENIRERERERKKNGKGWKVGKKMYSLDSQRYIHRMNY